MAGRGLIFQLDQLNPKVRAQVEQKLNELRSVSTVRSHICKDDPIFPTGSEARTQRGPWKVSVQPATAPTTPATTTGPRRIHRAALIPKLSDPEERLAFYLKAEGLGGFVREYRFSVKRRWRFDFAYLAPANIAIEVDGGAGAGGRHTRFLGFERDCEKLNEAAVMGWRVLRFTPRMIKNGYAIRIIRRALGAFGK